ncbi:MAG: type I DNA topoisomerase [Bacteroidia bacterium]|nr:type I DNA topoisomerase [Bacteroidia bacterium]
MDRLLLIVESPTKAQTIRRLLGNKYEVVASQGHVRDLPERGLGLRIDKVSEGYRFTPTYQPLPQKAAIVQKIKQAVEQATQVYLATDEDREGEAIAWHLCELLGIDGHEPVRIAFHEITKRALQEALRKPRPLNFHLIEAQQARRFLDRIVGYQISPLLWRTFPQSGKRRAALSAGRVQSVALRLLVEREREIAAFRPDPTIAAEAYIASSPAFKAVLVEPEIPSIELGSQWLRRLVGRHLRVAQVQRKPRRRGPSAPFTTSTLQQEAQRRLGFSLQRTMRAAQNLYEKGLITYMRTDSVHLAPEALENIHEVILQRFGPKEVAPRTWADKKALHAQEAHEAIRPTDPSVEEAGDTPDERKLYALIWRRTLASQMTDALYEETVVKLLPEPTSDPLLHFEAKGRILTHPGFLLIYGHDPEEDEETTLPPLQEGVLLEWERLRLWERFPAPPARYTEGTLVRELEARGIGRPSTYAPTVETLLKRQYAERTEARVPRPAYTEILFLPDGSLTSRRHVPPPEVQRNKLIPTRLGIQVTDFLLSQFPDIMDYDFTARVEEELDQIAAEKLDWQRMLSAFYEHFTHELSQAGRMEKRSWVLGTDPSSGKVVSVYLSPRGAYVALAEKGDPAYKTASLPPTLSAKDISLEQALELLSFPREVGVYEGEPIVVRRGPYGYYIRHKGKNYPLPAGADPFHLTDSEAIEAIETRRHTESTVLCSFPEAQIEVIRGRYGPYIRFPGGTRSVPKDISPDSLTLEVCQALIEKKPQRHKRRLSRKK